MPRNSIGAWITSTLLAWASLACATKPETANTPSSNTSAGLDRGGVVRSPETTCEQVLVVLATVHAVQDAAALLEVQQDCNASLERLGDGFGPLADCLLAATTLAQLEACEKVPPHASLLRAVTYPPDRLCTHVLDVMFHEAGPDARMPPPEKVDEFTRNCIKDLLVEKQKLGSDTYYQEAACVVAAQTEPTLMACDPDPSPSP